MSSGFSPWWFLCSVLGEPGDDGGQPFEFTRDLAHRLHHFLGFEVGQVGVELVLDEDVVAMLNQPGVDDMMFGVLVGLLEALENCVVVLGGAIAIAHFIASVKTFRGCVLGRGRLV